MDMTPLEQIAREVAMTPGEISKFLEPFNVDLVSENKVSRHPLRLRRIRFSGTKQSADESGPFNFDHSFSDGCTSIASDKNLTGKTSVIAIAKWALRGEPDSDVSQNVRKWLEAITVQGTVDKLPFAIEFDPRKSTGQLTIGVPPEAAVSQFSNQAEFVETMGQFFSTRLELPDIPSFSNNKPGGTEVTHGWNAYLGTIWISDAKEDLLLGETTFANLPTRLLNMFVAVPFAEASYALGQAISRTEATAKLLAIDPGVDLRAERAAQIELELRNLRDQAAATPDPIATSGAVKGTTDRWRKSSQQLEEATLLFASVREDHNAAAGELQLLKREAAAGRVLRSRTVALPKVRDASEKIRGICGGSLLCMHPRRTSGSGRSRRPNRAVGAGGSSAGVNGGGASRRSWWWHRVTWLSTPRPWQRRNRRSRTCTAEVSPTWSKSPALRVSSQA